MWYWRKVERSLSGAVTIRLCPPGATEGVWYWRKVERSLSGAVTIRLCPPGATEGVWYRRKVERSLPGAVTIRLCPPGATEGVRYWRGVERSLPGAVTTRPCPPRVNIRVGEVFFGLGKPLLSSVKLQEAVREMPLDRILVESDAPYQFEHPYLLYEVVYKLAKLLYLSPQMVGELSGHNLRKFFSID